MFDYNPCCCMEISALHVPVDVYIFRHRPAHEAFVDERNTIPYAAASFPYLSFIVTALELSPNILTRAHLQKKKVEEERSSEDT